MPDFSSSHERDAWVKDHADYFTVVRYLGPRKGYERYEVPTLAEAEQLAGRMAEKAGVPYMIYAVSGIHDAFMSKVGKK